MEKEWKSEWIEKKKKVFPLCVWLREWKNEEIENSFVWLNRKVGG